MLPTLTPVDCPTTKYQDLTIDDGSGNTGVVCGNCPAGYKCLGPACVAPVACGPGKYSAANQDTCIDCPAGSYCPLTATTPTDIIQCLAGYLCPQGMTSTPAHSAQSCPAGKFCGAGAIAGTDCLAGTYNPTPGGSTIAACLQVPAGFYADVAGTSDITTNVCPAGNFCPAGTSVKNANPCPGGKYRSLTGGIIATDCGSCPTGYFCPEQCVTPFDCPQGYFCTAQLAEPIKCPIGTFGANTKLA